MPVSLTSWGQLVLVANPQQPASRRLTDLVDAARRRPGKINYASPGVGTPHHLSMELFKATNHVLPHAHPLPRHRAAPCRTCIGGQVDVRVPADPRRLGQVRAGKLTALAIGSARRHPLLPQVPTLEEAGAGKRRRRHVVRRVRARGHAARAIVQTVNHELHEILAPPDVRTAFETQGMDPATSTPAGIPAPRRTGRRPLGRA